MTYSSQQQTGKMHRQCALNPFPNLAENTESEKTRCQGEDVRTQSMKERYSRLDVCPPLNELMISGFGDLEVPYS